MTSVKMLIMKWIVNTKYLILLFSLLLFSSCRKCINCERPSICYTCTKVVSVIELCSKDYAGYDDLDEEVSRFEKQQYSCISMERGIEEEKLCNTTTFFIQSYEERRNYNCGGFR